MPDLTNTLSTVFDGVRWRALGVLWLLTMAATALLVATAAPAAVVAIVMGGAAVMVGAAVVGASPRPHSAGAPPQAEPAQPAEAGPADEATLTDLKELAARIREVTSPPTFPSYAVETLSGHPSPALDAIREAQAAIILHSRTPALESLYLGCERLTNLNSSPLLDSINELGRKWQEVMQSSPAIRAYAEALAASYEASVVTERLTLDPGDAPVFNAQSLSVEARKRTATGRTATGWRAAKAGRRRKPTNMGHLVTRAGMTQGHFVSPAGPYRSGFTRIPNGIALRGAYTGGGLGDLPEHDGGTDDAA